MNTQLGSTMMVVSGCFAPTSTAPVAVKDGQELIYKHIL